MSGERRRRRRRLSLVATRLDDVLEEAEASAAAQADAVATLATTLADRSPE